MSAAPAALPFVTRPPADPALATSAARRAAAAWGLPEPQHLRTGMNALFTAGEEVVLRVSCTTAPAEQAVWLAGRLSEIGVRVPRQLRAQPLVAEGLAVFAIEQVAVSGAIDWQAVGEMVRRVHGLPAADVRGRYPLPPSDSFPWWNATAGLADIDDLLDPAARAGLHAAVAQHGNWPQRVSERVVCHGDVHPGNVLQAPDGPVLIDWDLLCHAPAAWDHASVMTWPRQWGGEPTMYERFADGYGCSLAGDPLAESLAVMRNAIATIMRVKAGRTDAAAAVEAELRLRFWRGDPAAPMWNAQ